MVLPSPLIPTENPSQSPQAPSDAVNFAVWLNVLTQPLVGLANTYTAPFGWLLTTPPAYPKTIKVPSPLIATLDGQGVEQQRPCSDVLRTAVSVALAQPVEGFANTNALAGTIWLGKFWRKTIVLPSPLMATDAKLKAPFEAVSLA